MTPDLEKIATVQELLEKQAFLGSIVGAAGRMAWRGARGAGSWAAKNPGKILSGSALGIGFGAFDVADAMKASASNTAQSRAQASQLRTEPTF